MRTEEVMLGTVWYAVGKVLGRSIQRLGDWAFWVAALGEDDDDATKVPKYPVVPVCLYLSARTCLPVPVCLYLSACTCPAGSPSGVR
jgi:hypothetical protein